LDFVPPFSGETKEGWEGKTQALIERLKPWFTFGCNRTKRGIVADAEGQAEDIGAETWTEKAPGVLYLSPICPGVYKAIRWREIRADRVA
jgi:hypothetical protein